MTPQSQPQPPRCRACGGRLLALVRVRHTETGNPVTYYRCEQCSQIQVVEG